MHICFLRDNMTNDAQEPKPPPWPAPNINTTQRSPSASNPSYAMHRLFKQTKQRKTLNSAKFFSTTKQLEATHAKRPEGTSLDPTPLTQTSEVAAAYNTYLLTESLPDNDSLDHAPMMSLDDAPDYGDDNYHYDFFITTTTTTT